jgi:hypothetical protein
LFFSDRDAFFAVIDLFDRFFFALDFSMELGDLIPEIVNKPAEFLFIFVLNFFGLF